MRLGQKPAPPKSGYAVLDPQNYQAVNYGSVYVGAGIRARAPLAVAAATTPRMGPMLAHSLPVSYAIPSASARYRNALGMITPSAVIKGASV